MHPLTLNQTESYNANILRENHRSNLRVHVSEPALVFSHQARVSNADPDHGGSQRGGSERCQGATEGQRSEGPAAGVHRGRGEEVKSHAGSGKLRFCTLICLYPQVALIYFNVMSRVSVWGGTNVLVAFLTVSLLLMEPCGVSLKTSKRCITLFLTKMHQNVNTWGQTNRQPPYPPALVWDGQLPIILGF